MTPTKIVELIIADDSQELAIDAISLVTSPAIEQDFVYFGKEKNNLTFAKVDEEKRMLVSPALIPNKQIFRHDPNTDSDYYVYFSKDTVRKASELYLKHNNHHKATYQHQDRVSGVLTVESWIKEGDQDKSKLYGYDLPNGTWFVKMKIENDELWQKIKEGELKGLSIEGYFTNKFEQMQKKEPTTEQILSALNDLIRENKTEFKTEKVELGAIDDFTKAFEKALNEPAADKLITDLRKAEVGFEKAIKLFMKAEDIGEDLKKAAKDLGVDLPKVVLNKIESSKAGVKEYRNYINKIQSMYNMF
jgi:hypothetical protein